MASSCRSHLLQFLVNFLFVTLLAFRVADAATGVTWAGLRYSSTPLSYTGVSNLLFTNGIKALKLDIDSDPNIFQVLAGTDVEVALTVTNDNIELYANSYSNAQLFVSTWVSDRLKAKSPVNIKWIVVGQLAVSQWEVGDANPYYAKAARNIYNALVDYQIDTLVKVTVPFTTDILSELSPPSAGAFNDSALSFMSPILNLLQETNSRFWLEVFPPLIADKIRPYPTLEYLYVNWTLGFVDLGSDLFYTNTLMHALDATYAALDKWGYGNVSVIIGEAGWPTAGLPRANTVSAQEFTQGLVNYCLSGLGTPARPDIIPGCFIRSLVDEDLRGNFSTEPNGPWQGAWGLFDNTSAPKYTVNFQGSKEVVAVQPQTLRWCVVRDGAKDSSVRGAYDWVCKIGKIDCSPLFNEDGACGNLTLQQQASYAFNEWWQRQGQRDFTCDFGGAARIVNIDPTVGPCTFYLGTDNPRSSLPFFDGNGAGTLTVSIVLTALLALAVAILISD